MKSDRPIDGVAPDSTSEWFNGLAGRPGNGTEHDDGARARAALVPESQDAPKATWRDIEARAGAEKAADVDAAQPGPPPRLGQARPDVAANESWPWRKIGWAAALVLGVGLVALMSPQAPGPDAALRGVAHPASSGPRWLVERPQEAAEALAAELRGLQAEVTVTRDGDAAILEIRAHPVALNAVNARLAVLETGLDAEGRLKLTVLPTR